MPLFTSSGLGLVTLVLFTSLTFTELAQPGVICGKLVQVSYEHRSNCADSATYEVTDPEP